MNVFHTLSADSWLRRATTDASALVGTADTRRRRRNRSDPFSPRRRPSSQAPLILSRAEMRQPFRGSGSASPRVQGSGLGIVGIMEKRRGQSLTGGMTLGAGFEAV